VNIFSPNKVAILFSVDLLCLLNYITETIHVTESRMLVSSDVKFENKMCKKNRFILKCSKNRIINLEHVNTKCLNITHASLSQHKKKKTRGAQIITEKLLTN